MGIFKRTQMFISGSPPREGAGMGLPTPDQYPCPHFSQSSPFQGLGRQFTGQHAFTTFYSLYFCMFPVFSQLSNSDDAIAVIMNMEHDHTSPHANTWFWYPNFKVDRCVNTVCEALYCTFCNLRAKFSGSPTVWRLSRLLWHYFCNLYCLAARLDLKLTVVQIFFFFSV